MLKLLRRCIISFIFFLSVVIVQAQRANVWCFGKYAGLNFNYSPPKTFTSKIRDTITGKDTSQADNSSSISDCSGNLLFYASTSLVFNRVGRVMPHGHLITENARYRSPVMIIPLPQDNNRYYVFHGSWTSSDTGLYYSIVDMRLDSGLGDVVDTEANILINGHPTPIAITKQANNTDYWLVTLPFQDSLFVYPVTNKGIGIPVKQKIVHTTYDYRFFQIQQLRMSHGGGLLAITSILATPTMVEAYIFNFDNNAGSVSNANLFYKSSIMPDEPEFCEFSANDSFLYFSQYGHGFSNKPLPVQILQFRVSQISTLNNFSVVDSSSSGGGLPTFSFQLGPDNKIYFQYLNGAYATSTWLGCINYPDKAGKACGIVNQVIDLAPDTAGLYMPNLYFPVYPLEWLSPTACADTVYFNNVSDTGYFRSFIWYFGDGDSSISYNAKHHYAQNGKYLVRLLGVNSCGARNYWTDSITVTLPPDPGFAIDSTVYSCGLAKTYVHTTATDSGQTYAYNFGDSATWVIATSLVHIYNKSGTYTVSQALFNGLCYDTIHTTLKINIASPPIAAFSAKDSTGCSGFALNLINNSKGAIHYKWLFDGGNSDTSFEPVHYFNRLGYHSVKLITLGSQGCVDSVNYDSFALVVPSPVSDFSYLIGQICKGEQIQFKNQSKNSTGYLWNFGDSTTDTTTSPLHLYSNKNNYKIALIASNKYCSDTSYQTITTKRVPLPVASFAAPVQSACPASALSFTNTSTNASTWEWNFGDTSAVDTTQSPSHAWLNPGKYNISLVATDSIGCSDSIIKNKYIIIVPYPKASFGVKNKEGCTPFSAMFINKSLNASNYHWYYDDGKEDTLATPTHIFTQTGYHSVKLVAYSPEGCDDSITIDSIIEVLPQPSPSFTYSIQKQCTGNKYGFTNTSANATNYLWYFGDGTTDTATSPVHKYSYDSTYTATLVAYNQYCSDTMANNFTVTITPKADTAFKASTKISCPGMPVTFTASDSAAAWTWYFGDGATDTGKIVNHVYPSAGSYTIKLIVFNSIGCSDSAIKSKYILITPFPQAAFSAKDTTGCPSLSVQFQNSSKNAYSYKWIFGDGATDTSFAPTHNFTSPGYYSIKLEAYNQQGCEDSMISDSFIHVVASPVSTFTYTIQKQCNGNNVTFTNTSTHANKYLWNFGDGNTDTAANPVHLYTTGNSYGITLTAKNTWCTDTSGQSIEIIREPLPKAVITSTINTACINNPLTLSSTGANTVSQQWNFGDSTAIDTAKETTHSWASPGKYTVRLTVKDSIGCEDSAIANGLINILPYPKAQTSIADSSRICGGKKIIFYNNSLNADSVRINFGDGKTFTSTLMADSIAHIYQNPGNYTLLLTAMNGYCQDTQSLSIQIYIPTGPKAFFQCDTVSVCLGTPIYFHNQSTDANSYLWNFGDGTTDNSYQPSHTYSSPGKYTIQLIAYNPNGCSDTLIKTNYIQIADTFSALISASSHRGCLPLTIAFSSPTQTKDLTLQYIWNFGDNAVGTGQNTSHTYTGHGDTVYSVKLTVSNGLCSDSALANINIKSFDKIKDTIQMRLATVQNDTNILVLWNKHSLAAHYMILRAPDPVQFINIATVTDTFYMDNNVHANAMPYYYKIIGMDSCNGESSPSPVAKTILLQATADTQDIECNAEWNASYGLKGGVDFYSLLRDNTVIAMNPNFTSYNDTGFFTTDSFIRCYIAEAQGYDGLISRSNEVCVPVNPRLFIPNAFTPNNDGLNDVYKIAAAGIKSFSLVIYNRWGERIFETTDPNKGWDGSFNGAPADIGVYLYLLTIETSKDEWISKNGVIHLIK